MNVQDSGASKNPMWLLLTALTVLALGLRMFHLDVRSIWLDEAYSLNLARADWAGILGGARADIHPPLFYLALSRWIDVFGTSEWGARSLSALLGALLVPAAFALADALADRRAAWWTATLVAVSPYFIELSRSARMAALLALGAALSWYCFVQVFRGRGTGAAAGYVLCTLAALYTHYFAFLLLVAQNAWAVLGARRLNRPRQVLRLWGGLQLALLVGYAPWLPTLWQHAGKGGPAWRGVGAAWTEPLRSLWTFALGTACWTPAEKVLGASALAAAAGVAVWRLVPLRREIAARLTPRHWGQVAIVLVLPLGLVSVYSVGRLNVFDDRYLSASALAGTMLAAVVLSSLPPRAAALTAGLVLAGFAVPLHNLGFVNGYRDDWRTVATDLVAASRPGDQVAVFPAWDAQPLEYYLRSRLPVHGLPGRYDPVLGPAGGNVTIDRTDGEDLLPSLEPGRCAWLVLVGSGATQGVLRDRFGARFRLASERRYGDIVVLAFVPDGRPTRSAGAPSLSECWRSTASAPAPLPV